MADPVRKPLRLKFGADEAGVISVLRPHSAGVYLIGGGVLGKVAGTELPCLNLMTESKAFGKIKRDLFTFGVAPISTPEMPENFIRFVYQSKPYSVCCLGLRDFLKGNVLGGEVPLIPLAHNFLVYAIDDAWVIDPYGALAGSQERGKGRRAKLLLEPEAAVAGLECCLAAAFDTALLGLELPAGHTALERRALAGTASEKDAPIIVHHLINYFPDLLEIRGYDFTRRYLRSPLCASAAAIGPGIDLGKACASLEAARARGQEITSVRLFKALNHEFCKAANISALGAGIPDYMAAKRLRIRRTDLLAEALGGDAETRV